MTVEYALQPLDAYMAAQISVALVLAALLWARPLRPWFATLGLLFAIGLAVAAPATGQFLTSIGVHPPAVKTLLLTASVLAAAATCATRRWGLAACGVAVLAVMWPVTRYIRDCDPELAAAYLALDGLIVGMHWRTSTDPAPPSKAEPPILFDGWKDDGAAFGVGTLVGVIACLVLLHAGTASGDEWAYTYQAALFAKLHAYGALPACSDAFRSFWVFQWMGRSFAQYTPGWPYFMAPFVAAGVAWMAGPVSLGLLAAGVCRLGRRAAAGCARAQPSSTELRAAGLFAAAVIVFATNAAINGGSRYPHVFEAAVFAWALEALLTVATKPLTVPAQWVWGAVLGTCASLMLIVRPADGASLGIGLFLYCVYALARSRIAWRSLTSAVAAFALLGTLTLVILRLQIGRWFATGYSLTPTIYPWAAFGFSLPGPNEYRYGIPLAVGAYSWWPCSPAVGLAGVVALRGRATRMAVILTVSSLAFLALYTLAEFGRGGNFGYGPRFHVPLFVPMGVGTGVVLARLWAAGTARRGDVAAMDAGGPIAVALVAVLLGIVRIAPLVLPLAYADAHSHSRLREEVAKAKLHHAVVLGGRGIIRTDPMDLTENLPLDLYPHQNVLIANEYGPLVVGCIREQYPDRAIYRALPGEPLRIVPY
jgi:hypothetical protein